MKRLTGLIDALALSLATFTGSVPLPVPAGLPVAEVVSLDAEPAAAIQDCHQVRQLTRAGKWWIAGSFAAWGAITQTRWSRCWDVNIRNDGWGASDFVSVYWSQSRRQWIRGARGWVHIRPGQSRVTISNIRPGSTIRTGSTARSFPMTVAT